MHDWFATPESCFFVWNLLFSGQSPLDLFLAWTRQEGPRTGCNSQSSEQHTLLVSLQNGPFQFSIVDPGPVAHPNVHAVEMN